MALLIPPSCNWYGTRHRTPSALHPSCLPAMTTAPMLLTTRQRALVARGAQRKINPRLSLLRASQVRSPCAGCEARHADRSLCWFQQRHSRELQHPKDPPQHRASLLQVRRRNVQGECSARSKPYQHLKPFGDLQGYSSSSVTLTAIEEQVQLTRSVRGWVLCALGLGVRGSPCLSQEA
jgi:hypothetical protein